MVLVAALILCLLPMPYGYYTLTRLFVVLYFGYLALTVRRNTKNSQRFILFYVGIIILFQPFVKLPLGRNLWNVVDVALAIWILFHLGKRK